MIGSVSAQTGAGLILLDAGSPRQVITPFGQEQTIDLQNLKKGETYLFSVPAAEIPGDCRPDIALVEPTAQLLDINTAARTLYFKATTSIAQLTLSYPCTWDASNPPRHYVSISCQSCEAQKSDAGLADLAVLEVTPDGADELIRNVFVGGDCFDVKNVVYHGTGQIGQFTNGLTNIGFTSGMLMTTGDIYVAPGPNDRNGAGGGGASFSDNDLSTISTGALFDLSSIEFDFTPTQTPFSFEYVFASEEYCEYVSTAFNDVFGFFISGPGISGVQNLALIPSSNTPITINTVNHITNAGLYVANTPAGLDNCENGGVCACLPPQTPATNPGINELQYDGFTRKMTAVAAVVPCATYHIKLAIADVGDGVWDSAVFLKGGSFDGGGEATLEWLVNGASGVNQVAEGSGTVALRIARRSPNTSLPLAVSFVISGTATLGPDYSPISSVYVIPAGQDHIDIPVNIINDMLPEGAETLVLTLNNVCSCLNPNTTLTIQDPLPAALNVDVGPDSGANLLSFSIIDDCTSWSVAGAPSWLTVTLTGNLSVLLNYAQNTLTTPRTANLTVTGCGFTMLIIVTQSGAVPITPPWIVDTTGRNHTIILPTNLVSDVQGAALQPGDWVGMFYDAAGTLKCAGYGVWSGSNTAFAVYGNDAQPPAKNGFNSGEAFRVKIWSKLMNQVFDATAQYAPVGTLGIVTHTNAFADDGISMITNLSTALTHAIVLNSGWNMISSYIMPAEPGMLDVFEPVASSIVLVKDGAGASCIPVLGINSIGDWNIQKGYQVNANKKDTLIVAGLKAAPESTPVSLQTGWQIIGYLRDSPQNIATVFNAIQAQISLVKDNAGHIYSPQFGINTIGDMKPCEGYKVKALSNVTLVYQANATAPADERSDPTAAASEMTHFLLDGNLNTGNNATIVLPDAIAREVLVTGDEIGVFTPLGKLCGAAGYHEGENLAITVWGDDLNTGARIEGIRTGEHCDFRLWKAAEQKEYTPATTFQSGILAYAPDAVEIVSGMPLNAVGVRDVSTAGILSLSLFPNPASENIHIGITSKEAGTAQLTIFSGDGMRVLDLKAVPYLAGTTTQSVAIPEKLPSGLYWFRFQFEKGTIYRQVMLQE